MNQANWAVQFAGKLREEGILELAVDSLDEDNPPELVKASLDVIAAIVFLPENRKLLCRPENLEPIVSIFKECEKYQTNLLCCFPLYFKFFQKFR